MLPVTVSMFVHNTLISAPFLSVILTPRIRKDAKTWRQQDSKKSTRSWVSSLNLGVCTS